MIFFRQMDISGIEHLNLLLNLLVRVACLMLYCILDGRTI